MNTLQNQIHWFREIELYFIQNGSTSNFIVRCYCNNARIHFSWNLEENSFQMSNIFLLRLRQAIKSYFPQQYPFMIQMNLLWINLSRILCAGVYPNRISENTRRSQSRTQVTNTHEYSALRAVNISLISTKTDPKVFNTAVSLSLTYNILFKLSTSINNIWFYSQFI